MPTYQYACTACDERLEVVQKFTDDALTVCEACGGKLRKLFSAVGIVFKGSGFYRTDSRNGSNGSSEANGAGKKDSPAASNGSEATSGSGASAGDGKPAKKADAAGASAPAAGAKVA